MGFLFVALGGALGAVGRYAISLIPLKSDFPFLTLITNILGAVLIGFVTGLVCSKDNVSPNAALFWKTGVCGGFTTFSTFSKESLDLAHSGRWCAFSAYVFGSVAIGIAAVALGYSVAKH